VSRPDFVSQLSVLANRSLTKSSSTEIPESNLSIGTARACALRVAAGAR
jgi:hypothetical protein